MLSKASSILDLGITAGAGRGGGDGEVSRIGTSSFAVCGVDFFPFSFLAGFGAGSGDDFSDWVWSTSYDRNIARFFLTSESLDALFLLFFVSTSLSLEDSEDETSHDQPLALHILQVAHPQSSTFSSSICASYRRLAAPFVLPFRLLFSIFLWLQKVLE